MKDNALVKAHGASRFQDSTLKPATLRRAAMEDNVLLILHQAETGGPRGYVGPVSFQNGLRLMGHVCES